MQISVLIPEHGSGSYWEQVFERMKRFLNDSLHLNIELILHSFDQYDRESFRKSLQEISQSATKGIIFPPFFTDETMEYAALFNNRSTPFIFIDSNLPEALPLSYFGQDSYKSGLLIGRILNQFYRNGEVLTLNFMGPKGQCPNQSKHRLAGIIDYKNTHNSELNIRSLSLISDNDTHNIDFLKRYIQTNERPQAVIVLNSLSNKVCDYLNNTGLQEIKVFGYDLTPANIAYLKEEKIEFLIGQRPIQQGYNTLRSLANHLFFRMQVPPINYIPIDIIVRENIEFCESGLM